MEVFLCMEGYGEQYEANISHQKKSRITAEEETLEYWDQVADALVNNSKPRIALAVVDEMEKRGITSMPHQLCEIVEGALTLASEAT